MHGLTHQEMIVAQDYIAMAREAIKPLEVEFCTLGRVYYLLQYEAQETHPLSIPLDPTRNTIIDDDSFGLLLKHQGEPIACVCGRSVHAERSFCDEYITTYRLFGSKRPRMDFEPFEYVDPQPRIFGTVAYGGGSWVHPDWRDMKLWAVTSRLGKVLAFTHLNADFYVALMKHSRTQAARETLGWPNTRYLTKGYHPGREDWQCDIDIHWMNRDNFVDMLKDHQPILDVGQAVRERL